MVSNTYTPIIGGVEKSILSFTEQFKAMGHHVLIIAPEFDQMPIGEEGVLRVAAIRRFNGSDFSVRLPIPSYIDKALLDFKPDIVHSHHPFLLGDTALRIANQFQVPLIFTHHTKYEDYTHYIPLNSKAMQKFVIELSTGYADMADHVIAPSQSISDLIKERGVTTAISVIPTGIDLKKFSLGSANKFKTRYSIDKDVFIVGYVGRLAEEKNLAFLCTAVVDFLNCKKDAVFIVTGIGPLENEIKAIFDQAGLSKRLYFTGALKGADLVDAYCAMDVFAFASITETQGMVLIEAMATGVPVVAIDASGTREVLKDKINGRLIFEQSTQVFSDALNWVADLTPAEKKQIKAEALKTAQAYPLSGMAQRCLKIYQTARERDFVYSDIENSLWSKAIQRLKVEFDLLSNLVDAVDASMHQKIGPNSRKGLRLMGANEWSARLLGMETLSKTQPSSGLVMIQIDGLSELQLKKALKNGSMPHLQKMLRKERYGLNTFYSGLPSSTPSVQAELFYGVKGAVPAFSFIDRETNEVFKMINARDAWNVEQRLAKYKSGLLKGGSSYSNIFSGGSRETHFCAVDLGWDKVWRAIKPLKMVYLTILHFVSIIKTSVRLVVELILSIFDFGKGLLSGQDFFKELNFIPTRLGLSVLLRDLVTFGSRIDIVRQLPIIHVNFIGYDEHSHRRGPSSKFAHNTLAGIDHCIGKIYKEATRSKGRMYDVWIYSDHGQEDCISYTEAMGKTVQQAVSEVSYEFGLDTSDSSAGDCEQMPFLRVHYLESAFLNRLTNIKRKKIVQKPKKYPMVTAMGPIGHVYLPKKLSANQKKDFAKQLIVQAHIPLVFAVDEERRVLAWNADGEYSLPKDAGKIFGTNHPFLKEMTEDFVRLCFHPSMGDFMICGWVPEGQSYSFPVEGGSHGGPGLNETNGFVLLPNETPKPQKKYLRPIDLRDMALEHLRPLNTNMESAVAEVGNSNKSARRQLRVMSYNVHGCRGMDGRISPERIAKVISLYNPDVVVLQELDVNRNRSRGMDQPHLIAQYLRMNHHFYPSVISEKEEYGNAVLCRYASKLIQAQRLPNTNSRSKEEVRGAIWVEIDMGSQKIQLINTHLGLKKASRAKQIEELLGDNWLNHPACKGPVVLAGDFNTTAYSKECSLIQNRLIDTQIKMNNHKPKATWLSFCPLRRIDHVYVSQDFEVLNVEVIGTQLEKIASDHLPLSVDILLMEEDKKNVD